MNRQEDGLTLVEKLVIELACCLIMMASILFLSWYFS